MYVVDIVQLNMLIKRRIRTRDYDRANDVFTACRRGVSCREVRLSKVGSGTCVLLKFIIKVKP